MAIEAGWSKLRSGRWDAARESFERVLADGATPEACEGLSWAAWWRDDAEAVFAARERAFRLFATRANRGAPDGPAEYPYEYLFVVARTR